MTPDTKEPAHRVVILGGGFAGVFTAKYLMRMLRGRRDVHVELLASENYFVFQPLLPEVAAGGVNPNHVVNPIRDVLPHAQFRWCKIDSVDTDRKVVLAAQGEGRALTEVPYDHLVFALGKVSDLSAMPGASEHSLGMKDLNDAFTLRNHVIRCLELADIEQDPDEKRALLTFVVGGAGFSGVETVGELSEMLHRTIPSFHNVDFKDVRFCLVHSRDQVLPEMAPELGRAAERILRARNIEMIFNARVRATTRHGIHLSTGDFLPTRTFIATIGNTANPVAKKALAEGGFVEGKIKDKGIGVFETDLNLACVGQPGYWALGDNAGVPDPRHPGRLCPPTAQFAIRQAKTCARNILASIDGRPMTAFHARNLGMLASLGRRSGVADILGVKFSGFFAWVAWRGYYLTQLPGFVRKLRVFLDWVIDFFFPRDIAQIQSVSVNQLHVHHYEPGDLIIRRGEIGRELFIIRNGDVEVVAPTGDGGEKILAALSRGEVFGEKALLEDAPRNADVRAKTPVDVLVISRDDFTQMVCQFPVLDHYFDELMRKRYPEHLPADTTLYDGVRKALANAARQG
jgi:NADH dehydrogenase